MSTSAISKDRRRNGARDEKKRKISIKLKLINSIEFSVHVSQKVDELTDLFKKVDSKYRSYDYPNYTWTFKILKYSGIIRGIVKYEEENGAKVKGKVWNPVVKLLQQFYYHNLHALNISSNEVIKKAVLVSVQEKLNPKFSSKLYDYQLEGVSFIVSRGGSCILGDEIGLGKRIQSIAIADVYKGSWPLLIIAPECLVYSWHCELMEWMPNVLHYKILMVDETTTCERVTWDYHIVIINFQLVAKHIKNLIKNNYGMVILDEISCLRTTDPTFEPISRLVLASERRLLLTSDPMYQDPRELLKYFSIVNPKLFPSELVNDAVKRYEIQEKSEDDFVHHRSEFKRLLHGTLLLRRTRGEVYQQLPLKQRKFLPFTYNISKQEHLILKTAYTKIEKLLEDVRTDSTLVPKLKRKILKWYEDSSRLKIRFLEDYLKNSIHMKFYKVVCFTFHAFFAEALCNVLEDHKVKYVRMDQNTRPEDRQKLAQNFQTERDIQFAILPLDFGKKEKLNLTAADCVLICELHWNPEVLHVAENFTFGVKQEEPNKPFIQYFGLVQNVYHTDHLFWNILNKKLKITNVTIKTSVADFKQPCPCELHDNAEFDSNLESFLKDEMRTADILENEKTPSEQNDKARQTTEDVSAYEGFIHRSSYTSVGAEESHVRSPEGAENDENSAGDVPSKIYHSYTSESGSESNEEEIELQVRNKKRSRRRPRSSSSDRSSSGSVQHKRRVNGGWSGRLRGNSPPSWSGNDGTDADMSEDDFATQEFDDLLWGRENYDPDYRPGASQCSRLESEESESEESSSHSDQQNSDQSSQSEDDDSQSDDDGEGSESEDEESEKATREEHTRKLRRKSKLSSRFEKYKEKRRTLSRDENTNGSESSRTRDHSVRRRSRNWCGSRARARGRGRGRGRNSMRRTGVARAKTSAKTFIL